MFDSMEVRLQPLERALLPPDLAALAPACSLGGDAQPTGGMDIQANAANSATVASTASGGTMADLSS